MMRGAFSPSVRWAFAAGRPKRRSAFTLFELVLAIALSVALVAVIGTAINLYLTHVDASRTQVEEAQLARSILSLIADDIRGTSVYMPQDTSAIAQLIASGTPFDVDDIDAERTSGGDTGGTGGTGASGSTSSGSGTSGTGSAAGGMTPASMSSGSGQSTNAAETMPLGLNGTVDELYVDATHLPRREELFATVTGYTNAPMGVQQGAGASATSLTGVVPPSDLKSIRYFVRPGQTIDPASAGATSLDPNTQLVAGGLVRQEIPRTMRIWAEQSGNTAILESGQALIAPEVVHIEFRYFDGAEVVDVWDMLERSALPMAVEVSLWIAPLDAEAADTGRFDATNLANKAHEYRQTVYLPMSQVASSASGVGGAGGASSGTGESGTGAGTSSSGSSGSGASGSQSGF